MAASDHSYSLLSVILIFLVPGIADLLYGYDCGAMSFAILQLQDPERSGVTWSDRVAYSPTLQGAIVSTAALGALLASVLIYTVVDASRIRELQIGAILYINGACLQVASYYPENATWALTLLLIGRLVYGLGIGVSMHAINGKNYF